MALLNRVDYEPQPRPLEERFLFELNGHELVDPETNRGYVSSVTKVDSVSMAGNPLPEGVDVYEVEVVDPFVAADPEGYQIVKDYVNDIESAIREEGFVPLLERQKEHPYRRDGDPAPQTKDERRNNKFTRAWLSDSKVQALKAWHSLIPSAKALGFLTNPWVSSLITTKKGEVIPSTPETAAHLRFVDDAVAIRDRATVMQFIAESHLMGLDSHEGIRWLSLASGTAEPSIAAAQSVINATGANITLDLVDNDSSALDFVSRNATVYGFEGEFSTYEQDIMFNDFTEVLPELANNPDGWDIVENTGFEEYFPQDGDEIGAFRNIGIPQASEFTARAWKLVKPGGALISGNMVLDRPQVDFVFGIVNWPIINARSEEAILNVYKQAGIIDDPCANIEIVRVRNQMTGSHVYDIVKVTKLEVPEESEQYKGISRLGATALSHD